MVDFEGKEKYGVYDLQKLIALLRSPEGCPWDHVQTHESIRRNLLEEAYEAAEAIDTGDTALLLEELGDVLLQVVFHIGIEADAGHFDLDDVADAVCRKMIFRHPALFSEAGGPTGDDLDSWEAIKRTEKHQETVADALTAVARSLPALWRAEKVQKKAEKGGLALPADAWLDALCDQARRCRTEPDAVGGLLFLAVQAARQLEVDPEAALTARTDAFIDCFRQLEADGALGADTPEARDKLQSQIIAALSGA